MNIFSIEHCRELIPDGTELTDAEIVDLREHLYETAELALEIYFHRKRKKA